MIGGGLFLLFWERKIENSTSTRGSVQLTPPASIVAVSVTDIGKRGSVQLTPPASIVAVSVSD